MSSAMGEPVGAAGAGPGADATAAAGAGAQAVGAPVLEARGLVKRYGHVTAMSGADFELRAGEVLAVIGDNGAGKSTLIKALSGAVIPDEGEILLDGKASDFPSSRTGNGSALCSSPTSFTCFACTVVPLSEDFCLPCSFRELLIVLILSLFSPSRKKNSVLWLRLTPAISICPLEQGCLSA